MKFEDPIRALALLAMFTVPALAVQRPKPAPAPTPVPAPAPAPAQDSAAAQREQQAKEKQRAQHAREAEAERQRQEQEATRIKRARAEAAGQQDHDAERVKRAREEAAQQGGQIPGRERAALRDTARDMFKIEDVHRDRLARIDRLEELYTASGDTEKLAEIEKLKARENKRYVLIMGQFKEKLGPAYGQFEPRLREGQKGNEAHRPAPVPVREAKSAPKNSTGGGK